MNILEMVHFGELQKLHGAFEVVHEFDNEEDFKNEIINIINSCGIIGKVYIKEMPDNYTPLIHYH